MDVKARRASNDVLALCVQEVAPLDSIAEEFHGYSKVNAVDCDIAFEVLVKGIAHLLCKPCIESESINSCAQRL